MLLDDLGERWGKTHTYHNLRSPADAIKLLCVNYPDFQEYLLKSHEDGIGYTIVQAEEYLGVDDLHLPLGVNDLVIAPVVMGSGGDNALTKILLGAVIIAAAVFLGPAVVAAAGGSGTVLGAAAAGIIKGMIYVGAALVIDGIADIIAPQQDPSDTPRYKSGEFLSTDGPQSVTRGSDGKASYAYGGASNNIGVGATVPVCYGKALIGSHLASARIEVADESDPLMANLIRPGVDTVRIGGKRVSSADFEEIEGLKTRSFKSYKLYCAPDTTTTTTDDEGNETTTTEDGQCEGWYLDNFVELTRGNTDSLAQVKGEEPDDDDFDVRKFQILLKLENGLFKYVSGPGTTRVPGFITYRVEVFDWHHEGNRPLVGSAQATIQALLNKNQTYRWAHQFRFQKISGHDNYKVKITIIDFSAEEDRDRSKLNWRHYLRVTAVGYKTKFFN